MLHLLKQALSFMDCLAATEIPSAFLLLKRKSALSASISSFPSGFYQFLVPLLSKGFRIAFLASLRNHACRVPVIVRS